jgi:hypothetical protein
MQCKRFSWTNAASAVARNLDCGFKPAKVEIWDLTTPNRHEWTANMADASVFTLGTLAYTTTNGVTPLSESAEYGQAISGITAANPAVITVSDAVQGGFAAGDTIKVAAVADAATGTTLNGEYTIASISGNALTTATDTSSGYSAYVSGGTASRVSDTNGNAIPTENKSIQGLTLGTSAVGANSASMCAIVYGEEPVV